MRKHNRVLLMLCSMVVLILTTLSAVVSYGVNKAEASKIGTMAYGASSGAGPIVDSGWLVGIEEVQNIFSKEDMQKYLMDNNLLGNRLEAKNEIWSAFFTAATVKKDGETKVVGI